MDTKARPVRYPPLIYPTQPPGPISRHPAYRLCSRAITSGLLIKPAVLSGVVGQGAWRNGSAALAGKPKSHPVKPFVDRADEGFVGMLFEAKGGQRVIKVFHGFAQVPACARKNKKIIHVPHVVDVRIGGHRTIKCIQMKCAQQRAKCTAAGNPFGRRMKLPALLDAVMNNLLHQREQMPIGHVRLQLGKQPCFIDVGVILANIGPADVVEPAGAQQPMHPRHRGPAAPVPAHMLAGAMNRQTGVQPLREAAYDQGIGGRPERDALTRGLFHHSKRREAIGTAVEGEQQPFTFARPVKPQVPDIGVRRKMPALCANPAVGGINGGRVKGGGCHHIRP